MKKRLTKKRIIISILTMVLLLLFFPTTCTRHSATVKLKYYDMTE